MKQTFTKSHELVINTLKENGYDTFNGGIQLFADQFDKEYSVSINYMSTGIHISRDKIIESELVDDEMVRVCKSWTYRE